MLFSHPLRLGKDSTWSAKAGTVSMPPLLVCQQNSPAGNPGACSETAGRAKRSRGSRRLSLVLLSTSDHERGALLRPPSRSPRKRNVSSLSGQNTWSYSWEVPAAMNRCSSPSCTARVWVSRWCLGWVSCSYSWDVQARGDRPCLGRQWSTTKTSAFYYYYFFKWHNLLSKPCRRPNTLGLGVGSILLLLIWGLLLCRIDANRVCKQLLTALEMSRWTTLRSMQVVTENKILVEK